MMERFFKNSRAVFVFFLALNFIAHFLYFIDFGLYELDYRYILPAMEKDITHVWALFVDAFKTLASGSFGFDGRPLGHISEQAIPNVGANIGGLKAVYLFSLLLSTLCSFLTYRVFAVKDDHATGLVAALAFTLYPAYALRQFLNAQYQIFPAFVFMLLAMRSYTAEKRIQPYIFIAITLLSYESLVFPFLAVPLLIDTKWDLKFLKKLVVHGLIVTAMVAVVVVVRGMEGESRIAGMGGYASEIPARMAVSMAYGIFISVVYASWFAARETCVNLNVVTAAAMLIAVPIISCLLYISTRLKADDACLTRHAKGVLAGFALLALSYVTGFYGGYNGTLTEPITTLLGLGSRLHVVASFGTAVFLASLFMLAARVLKHGALRLVVACSLGLILSVFLGYAIVIQEDYKKAWQYQRCLWTNIINKSPDISMDTLILVDSNGLPITRYIYPYSWPAMPIALEHIYDFPTNWKSAIMLKYYPNWLNETALRLLPGGKVEINHTPPAAHTASQPRWEQVPQRNVIYLKGYRGELERMDGALTYKGAEVLLKPKPDDLEEPLSLPKGYLYDYLITGDCSFNALAKATWAREIQGKPPLARTLGFDGKNHLKAALPESAGKNEFTIELWLRPGKNVFSIDGRFDNVYPPMPVVIGPLRLDHREEDVLGVSITTKDKKGVGFDVRDMLVGKEGSNWLHIELDVANERREALLFINGALVKRFKGITIPLAGDILLGKGYLERYWQGEIADVRISSIVRHTSGFEPEKTQTTKDAHTLYLMDGVARND